MSNSDSGWANPMPAGLTAFAVAVFIFYAMFTGKAPMGLAYAIAGFWLIGGFFVQIVVGIIELKMGPLLVGTPSPGSVPILCW
jgi:succinate-acetate transporter protein